MNVFLDGILTVYYIVQCLTGVFILFEGAMGFSRGRTLQMMVGIWFFWPILVPYYFIRSLFKKD